MGFKRARRKEAKRTILVYTEGHHDAALMRHLNSIYGRKRGGTFFKIKPGQGGSPITLAINLIKNIQHYQYDGAFVSFDTDVGPEPVDTAVRYLEESISRDIPIHGYIQVVPCMEAVLLSVLDSSRDYSVLSTDECKRIFHSMYMSEEFRTDTSKYAELLPEIVLEEARRRVPILDLLIRQFET